MITSNISDSNSCNILNRKRKSKAENLAHQSKMGKTAGTSVFKKRSAENILKDINDLKQRRKSKLVGYNRDGMSWHTIRLNCPQTDPNIPLTTFEKFLNHLSMIGHKRLQFWKKLYEEALREDDVEIIEDSDTEDEESICPLCHKICPKSSIEAHADECAEIQLQN